MCVVGALLVNILVSGRKDHGEECVGSSTNYPDIILRRAIHSLVNLNPCVRRDAAIHSYNSLLGAGALAQITLDAHADFVVRGVTEIETLSMFFRASLLVIRELTNSKLIKKFVF